MESAATSLEITKQIDFKAPIERVWAAISEPAQLARWFPESIECGALAPGVRGWFIWQAYGRFAFEVVEMTPPRRLVWRWSHEAGREVDAGPTTRAEFTLEERQGGGTRLIARETGFLTAKHHQENNGGWDSELGELVAYLGG
jgi:uncharacterized protein YndB with AHSA1/START domain